MPVCGFIHIYLVVYGKEIIVRLREIINLARGSRFLRVFCGGYSNRVERLRRLSGNFILLNASLFNKGLPLGLDQVSQGFPLCPRPCGVGR